MGPAQHHRWTKARNKRDGVCARARTSSQSLVQRLVSFKIYALFILSFISFVAEPDHSCLQPLQVRHWLRQSASSSLLHERPFVGPTRAKVGWLLGALRVVFHGLCAAPTFHTAEGNPGCFLGCHEGLDCVRHCNQCPALLESLCTLWLGIGKCISPTAIFNELLFKIAVPTRQTLHTGLLGFLTRSSLLVTCQRTNRGSGLKFKDLTYVWKSQNDDRIVSGVGSNVPDDVLRAPPRNISDLKRSGSPSRGKKFTMLSTCRKTTRLTGIEFPVACWGVATRVA